MLSHQIAEFSRQILALVGGIVLLTLMQPRLTLTALGVVPLVVGSALFFGRRLRRMTTSVQDKVAEATAAAEEAFSQIRTVQSFVQEPAERQRYGDRIGESVRAALVRANIRGVFFGVLTFSTFVGHRHCALAGWAAGAGRDSSRRASWFSSCFTPSPSPRPIGALASFFSSYQEAVGAAQRVFEILEMDPAIADPASPVAAAVTHDRGSVTFEGVSFRYQRRSGVCPGSWTVSI